MKYSETYFRKKNRQSYLLYILGISVLIYLGLNLIHDLNSYMDLDLGDEIGYINSRNNSHFFANRAIYPLWYKIISLFSSDNISLFYLNQKILILLTPICLFILLFTLYDNFIVCLLLPCLFLYSNTNIATEFIYNSQLIAVVNNKINNFTICVICLSGCILIYLKQKGWSLPFLTTMSFFFLSYCRNEFGVPFIISALIYLYLFIKRREIDTAGKYLFIISAFIITITVKFWGLSVLTTGYSNLHYEMSYSRNYFEWNRLPIFIDSNIISPCLEKFGNREGLAGFFFSNPVEFIKNMLYNIYNSFFVNSFRISDIFLPQVFLPYADKSILNYCLSAILTVILVYGAVALIRNRKMEHANHSVLFYFIVPSCIINVFTNTIYYFEPRSYIFFVPLFFICMTSALNNITQQKKIQLVSFIILLLILFEHISFRNYVSENNYKVPKSNIQTVAILNKYMHQAGKENTHIVSNNGSYDALVPKSKTSEFNYIIMFTDSNRQDKYNNLDSFDIFVINKTTPLQNYLWFNRITGYLSENKNSFDSITTDKQADKMQVVYLKKK